MRRRCRFRLSWVAQRKRDAMQWLDEETASSRARRFGTPRTRAVAELNSGRLGRKTCVVCNQTATHSIHPTHNKRRNRNDRNTQRNPNRHGWALTTCIVVNLLRFVDIIYLQLLLFNIAVSSLYVKQCIPRVFRCGVPVPVLLFFFFFRVFLPFLD